MRMWSLGNDDVEELANLAKIAILGALVTEELLDQEVADEWTGHHAVMLYKPGYWVRLKDFCSSKIEKEKKKQNTWRYLIVKYVPTELNKEEDEPKDAPHAEAQATESG